MKKLLVTLFATTLLSFANKLENAVDIVKQDFPLLKSTTQSFEISEQNKSGILLLDKNNKNNAAYLESDTLGKTAQFTENHISAAYIKTSDDRFSKGAAYFYIHKKNDSTYRAGVLNPSFARLPLKKNVPPRYTAVKENGKTFYYETRQPHIEILPIKKEYHSFSEAVHDIASSSPATMATIETALKIDKREPK